MPLDGEPLAQLGEQLLVFGREERGGWDGYRLVASREHRPAVAASLGDVELVAGLHPLDDGQVVNAAFRPVGESETRLLASGIHPLRRILPFRRIRAIRAIRVQRHFPLGDIIRRRIREIRAIRVQRHFPLGDIIRRRIRAIRAIRAIRVQRHFPLGDIIRRRIRAIRAIRAIRVQRQSPLGDIIRRRIRAIRAIRVRLLVIEVAVLYPDESAFYVEVGCLQPVGSLPVLPRRDSAPKHHTRVYPPLLEEEPSSFVAQPRMLEESGVATGIEGWGTRIFFLARIALIFGG